MLPVRKILTFQIFQEDLTFLFFSLCFILLKNLASWESSVSFVEEKYIGMYLRNESLVLSKEKKERCPRKR